MSAVRELFVCVRDALRVEGPLELGPDGRSLAPGCRRWVVDEGDRVALEAALRARASGAVDTVTCLGAVPAEADRTLTWCLAAGADGAARVVVPEPQRFEPGAAGALLAAVLRRRSARLVFTSARSSDGEGALLSAYLARALDAAYLSNAVEVRLTEDGVEIERWLERGHRQVWAAALPAVVSFAAGANPPRYVSTAALALARHRPLDEIDSAELAGAASSPPDPGPVLERLAKPRIRPKKIAAPLAGGSAADRLRALAGGGASGETRTVRTGTPETLAEEALAFLKERRLLRRKRPEPD